MATKSQLLEVAAEGRELRTASLPAYWIRGDGANGGHASGEHCQAGQESYNVEDAHPGLMAKVVTLGCFGVHNCVQFDITAQLGDATVIPPSGFRFAQLEGPTAYLGHDFSSVSYLNTTSGQLVAEVSRSEECLHPPVIHTPDEKFALGVVSPARPPGQSFPGLCYGYFSFPMTQWDQKTYKWSVVVREEAGPGHVLEVTSYLCVGDLVMVAECLALVSGRLE